MNQIPLRRSIRTTRFLGGWAAVAVAAAFLVLGVNEAARADGDIISFDRAAAASTPQAERESCRAVTFSGSSGRIDVQTSDTDRGPKVGWAITMYDERESVGRWDVDTYLNGKKTSSGFHRTTSSPYVPHGSVLARSGQRFNVEAALISVSGRTYPSVPNQCFVP